MGKYICCRLKELRLEKGLTQKELSELTNFPIRKLSKWERCVDYADLYELAIFGYIFDVKIQYIVGKTKDKSSIRH